MPQGVLFAQPGLPLLGLQEVLLWWWSRAAVLVSRQHRRSSGVCGEERGEEEEAEEEEEESKTDDQTSGFVIWLSVIIIDYWTRARTNLWCGAVGSVPDWTGITGAKAGKEHHRRASRPAGHARAQTTSQKYIVCLLAVQFVDAEWLAQWFMACMTSIPVQEEFTML